MTLKEGYKKATYNNPVMTQRFGADPYALVYDGRVYLYMTGDIFEYESLGEIKTNSYGKIQSICVISSSDLVNWTDHGTIYAAGYNGAATWANNSWAPAAACKKINSKIKFFLYFANSAGGIGVLTADSPTGPFTDPLGHPLISRETENCGNVTWLFDPAVLVDEDGSAYLYFGGGIPDEAFAHPTTARAVQLGEDMISIVGTPVSIDPPYLFEDSGINRIGDTYYYSYCTNWNVDEAGTKEYGIKNAHIAYMTSDSPLGPFTYQGSIMKNPGEFFGCYGNNHHCMFEFNGEWYMAYHTQLLERDMGVDKGYRCTQIDKVSIGEDGKIMPITMTRSGVEHTASLNPYKKAEAETMQSMGGIETNQYGSQSTYFGSGNMIVSGITTGSFITVSGVNFLEQGAKEFTASVRADKGAYGVIKLCLDSPDGEAIAYLEVTPDGTEEFREESCPLLTPVSGSHRLYLIFYGEGYELDYWYFK
ncbi:MAG: family 43 glycosylhydrolase [Lachnospiraceae bacterium]|nr:family 43 glycosylhydrolase [Lachnospiraceae bacterium]